MADTTTAVAEPKPSTEKPERGFFNRFYSGKPGEEKPEKKDEPKKDEPKKDAPQDAKPTETPKTDEPKPKKSKKSDPVIPPTPVAPVDFKELGKEIAKGVSEGLEKREKKDQPELGPEERETFSLIERLEKKYPEQYAGRAQEFVRSLKRADDYEAKWLADHPGETFNIDDNEHKAFRETNGLDDIDPDHFKAVEEDILAEKIEARVGKKYDKELQELKGDKKLREAAPKIIAARVGAARSFFDGLGDDFKTVLDANGNIVGAEIEKISADPAKATAFGYAQAVEEFADTTHRLINQIDELNERNPAHAAVLNYVGQLESSIKAMPVEEQLWNGKRFATGDEWEALPANQRQNYWRLTEGYINNCFAAQKSVEAKAAITAEEARLAKFAEVRGWKRQEPSTAQPSAGAKPAEGEKPKETPKDNPPSPPAAAEVRMAPKVGAPNGGNGSATRSFISLFGGR